jgi:hypothetical protein
MKAADESSACPVGSAAQKELGCVVQNNQGDTGRRITSTAQQFASWQLPTQTTGTPSLAEWAGTAEILIHRLLAPRNSNMIRNER